mgnify:CR=1 FL=1|uniref:DNA-directed RNA polymerase n=1 Tax=viral metagenome TaxID=1070528 RepID=A0A6C0CAM2_9ZZZZ
MNSLIKRNELDPVAVLRTISAPKDVSTRKLTAPRHVHPSFYGSICPLETPDGPRIGMVRNMPKMTSKL